METDAVEDEEEDETVVVKNEEGEEEEAVKEEEDAGNLDRCHKCVKASFKYKKEFYCAKCLREGMVKPAPIDKEPVQCKKCRKGGYRTKNRAFCKKQCPAETAMEVLGTSTEAAETTTTTVVPDLGILGNLFNGLVKATTFGTWEAPVADDVTLTQTAVVGA